MPLRDLSLADWARMSDEVARRECDRLAQALPHGLEFAGLQAHAYCGRSHRVARFSRREAGDLVQFVLVPGGEVGLGFHGQDFKPTRAQVKSFARSAAAYEIDPSIWRFVDSQTTVPRRVYVAPMLIEAEAREAEPREDLELLDPTDPLTEKYRLRLDEGRTHMEFYSGVLGEYRYIVERDGDGTCRVWRGPPTTVQWLEASLARIGMRLPTCDEWEHACGAGASTLFRWGDDSPDDYYPTDTCAEDRKLSRAWVLSAGTLAYERPPPTWTLHLQQNLFGVRIAHDPYKMDLVSDGPGALGGDGGCNICGGAGFFLGWLPLATAYANPDCAVGSTTEENIADEYHRVRRVIPLA